MSQQLSDRYDHKNVEEKTYKWWKSNKYFKAEDESKKPSFCIILPPPNVTGHLHMGHALDHTIQDVLIRWKRMSGFNALWLPGTDHAGIATQAVVEKQLIKNEKTSRHDLGREKFLDRIWDWKNKFGDRIYHQMEKLGDSVDWDRQTFTLDDGVSKAVRKVFVHLYKKGLIYKSEKLVNWSPPLQSAISDLEVVHKETKGNLWYIKYKVAGSDRYLEIATTRPETLIGDTAVCVHPEDDRYKDLIGKDVEIPLVGRKIKVIADNYVDMEFGTGALKVTPAHDFNDYELGKKHSLEFINILDKSGQLNEVAGKYQGLKAQEARKQIVKDLEEAELLIKAEPMKHSVGFCDRSGAVVEPYLSEQWFVKMEDLAARGVSAVEEKDVNFDPDMWTKTYLHWMNNIQDWCISRQLWWGHRIPVWTCENCGALTVSEIDPSSCDKCESKNLKQDEDVLDTWFSSALWPFSTLGWPEKTKALETFYPTNVLVTGHDIIFFWVARMIMSGLEFMDDKPFETVYIHGLIRDSQGRKMSKSLGNSIDPVEIIEEYGADSLRFTLMAQIASGKDIKFSVQRLEGYRNFMNKLWNATRFSLQKIEFDNLDVNVKLLDSVDHWILSRLKTVVESVNGNLEKRNFSEAANALYSFTWHEFCDWYVEFSKPTLYSDDNEKRINKQKVLNVAIDHIVRLLHPFTPFITEEIYQTLPQTSGACIVSEYPNLETLPDLFSTIDTSSELEVETVKEVISALRNVRGENSIKPSVKFVAMVSTNNDSLKKNLEKNKKEILRIAGLSDFHVSSQEDITKCAIAPIRKGDINMDVIVPLEGLVDFDEEIKRIQKIMDKSQKDIDLLSKKLGNENFVKNAPADIVEKDTLLLGELREKQKELQSSMERLK